MVMPMPPVPPVPMVHEDVHQGTGQQKEIGQGSGHVGKVFGQQEVRGHCTDHDQADRVPGTPEAGRSVVSWMLMVHGGGLLNYLVAGICMRSIIICIMDCIMSMRFSII